MNKKLLVSLLLLSFAGLQCAVVGLPAVGPDEHYSFRCITPPPAQMEEGNAEAWLKHSANLKAFEQDLTSQQNLDNFSRVYIRASRAVFTQNPLAGGLLNDTYDRIWEHSTKLKALYFHKKWKRSVDMELLNKLSRVADFYYNTCSANNFGVALLHYGIVSNLDEWKELCRNLKILQNKYYTQKHTWEDSVVQVPAFCVICNQESSIMVPYKDKDFGYSITCNGECTERHEDAQLLASVVNGNGE